MTTFDETKHPRGNAGNAGQFREKENRTPATVLTEVRKPEPTDQDREAAGRIAREFAVEHLIDGEGGESVYASIGVELGDGLGYEETIESLMARAYAAGRAEATKPGPLRLTDIVADATVMGGDEIRALPPRKLAGAHSMATRGAARLQDYMRELDVKPAPDAEKVRVVDLENPTEDDLGAVFVAAVNSKKLNASGVVRTRSDFRNELADRGDFDEETVETAWQHYVTNGRHSYEEAWGEKEYQAWQGAVDDSLQAVDNGWAPEGDR